MRNIYTDPQRSTTSVPVVYLLLAYCHSRRRSASGIRARDERPLHRPARLVEVGIGDAAPVIRIVCAVLQSLATLAILRSSVFTSPGPPANRCTDPAHVGHPGGLAERRRYLGLDRPYVEQYFSFVGKAHAGISAPRFRAQAR
jgi:hypothetical protein